MRTRRRIQIAFLAGLLIVGYAKSASALTVLVPDHDWTFAVGEYEFGVIGYYDFSIVRVGSGTFTFPYRAPYVVAGGGLLTLGIAAACVWCLSRWSHSTSREELNTSIADDIQTA